MRIEVKLTLLALAMFGFGYALVPLYSVFCDVTGFGGKTGAISAAEAEKESVDTERLVTVEFDTNVNSGLPWRFSASQFKMKVHPGEITEAVFVAENISADPVTGQAVPSVAPAKASLYFNKTECFCFSKQTLRPGERKDMFVRFVVDPELPDDIKTLTLSYTFFMSPQTDDAEAITKL